MGKNFNDFKPEITREMYLNAVGNEDKSFNLSKGLISGEITLDMSEMYNFLMISSVKLCTEVLKQYHEWNNLD